MEFDQRSPDRLPFHDPDEAGQAHAGATASSRDAQIGHLQRTPVGAGSQLQPGDFFGEMSLLDGKPRSATIVATTDLRLLLVDRFHFWRPDGSLHGGAEPGYDEMALAV